MESFQTHNLVSLKANVEERRETDRQRETERNREKASQRERERERERERGDSKQDRVRKRNVAVQHKIKTVSLLLYLSRVTMGTILYSMSYEYIPNIYVYTHTQTYKEIHTHTHTHNICIYIVCHCVYTVCEKRERERGMREQVNEKGDEVV